MNILYYKTFKKLKILGTKIHQYDDQIVGFSTERVDMKWYVDLYTNFGKKELSEAGRLKFDTSSTMDSPPTMLFWKGNP